MVGVAGEVVWDVEVVCVSIWLRGWGAVKCGRDLQLASRVSEAECSGMWQWFAFQLGVGGGVSGSVAVTALASGVSWGEV